MVVPQGHDINLLAMDYSSSDSYVSRDINANRKTNSFHKTPLTRLSPICQGLFWLRSWETNFLKFTTNEGANTGILENRSASHEKN